MPSELKTKENSLVLSDEKTEKTNNPIPEVGAIHIDEITPTLLPLQNYLGIDLINNTLGSVGKKQFSGDIDVAIQLDDGDIPEFIEKLRNCPDIIDVKKSSVIMTVVKIQHYDPSLPCAEPRTGYVQVDFMLGDIAWLKTFYHAPYEKDSKYKGVYRNILLSSMAYYLHRHESRELDHGQPIWVERYVWSPAHGLVRVIRQPVLNSNKDGYTKKHIDDILHGPYKTPEDIIDELGLGDVHDLYSYETLREAIDMHYNPRLVERIMSQFRDNPIIKQYGIPEY